MDNCGTDSSVCRMAKVNESQLMGMNFELMDLFNKQVSVKAAAALEHG